MIKKNIEIAKKLLAKEIKSAKSKRETALRKLLRVQRVSETERHYACEASFYAGFKECAEQLMRVLEKDGEEQ